MKPFNISGPYFALCFPWICLFPQMNNQSLFLTSFFPKSFPPSQSLCFLPTDVYLTLC